MNKFERRPSRQSERAWKPKLWIVCPKCDKLLGFIWPEAAKPSQRKGERGDAGESESPDLTEQF